MISSEEAQFLCAPDIDPIKQFIQKALTMKARGDPSHYNHIVLQLRTRDDPDMVWKLYISICTFVSQITARPEVYKDLMQCLYSYDWKLERKINIAFINLIGSIVSSNAIYLIPSLEMLVRNLVTALPPPVSSDIATEEAITYIKLLEEQRNWVHRAIKCLIVIAPIGQSKLYPILCEQFPYKNQPLFVLSGYVSQLLRICEYIPILQYKTLELIISKCLEIDVEILIEDNGDVKFQRNMDDDITAGAEDDDDQFILETSSPRIGSAIVVPTKIGKINALFYKESSQKISPEVIEMAEKLDDILVLLVTFIEKQLSAGEEFSDRIFNQLMGLFEDKLLVVHKSKFVQYIVFYAASKVPAYCCYFIKRILCILHEDQISVIAKQSAVAYLASFLSRANFVPLSYVNDAVCEIIYWCLTYNSKFPSHEGHYEITCSYTSRFSGCRTGLGIDGGARVKSARNSFTDLTEIENSSANCNRFGIPVSNSKTSLLDNGGFKNNVSFGNLTDLFSGSTLGSSNDLTKMGGDQAKMEGIANLEQHETFYCCVQAVAYVCCFHGSLLLDAQLDSGNIRDCWEVVISSPLMPMRYCLHSVRSEFVRILKLIEFLRVDHFPGLVNLLNSGSKSVESEYKSLHGAMSGNPLDSFFPFDPCLLCKLNQFVETGYRHWKGIPGVDEIDDVDNFYCDDDFDQISLSSDDLEEELEGNNPKTKTENISCSYIQEYRKECKAVRKAKRKTAAKTVKNRAGKIPIDYPDISSESSASSYENVAGTSVLSYTSAAIFKAFLPPKPPSPANMLYKPKVSYPESKMQSLNEKHQNMYTDMAHKRSYRSASIDSAAGSW